MDEKILEAKRRIKGAYVLENGDTEFSLYTFESVKEVNLQLNLQKSNILSFPMKNKGDGFFELVIKNMQKKDRPVRYRFQLIFNDGEVLTVKDPYSMWQDSYFRWSIIYDHNKFKWHDENWQSGNNKNRVSSLSGRNNNLKPVEKLSVYELHIGTLTKEGTFLSAKDKLKDIKNLGFNAIELMPVENTYSFNWGYDGVDKFAPNHTYGTPDDLKTLIDFAHKLELNVIMDIVPNHLGPDVAQLHETGPYISGCNMFGYKFNFENKGNGPVREYIVNTALNWLINYHCDGLRVDMTKFMESDYTMKQMAAEVRYYSPHSFLIAEDGRDNDERVTKQFDIKEQKENVNNHKSFISKISHNRVPLASLGFDSEWDFPFHKQIASAILGKWEGYTCSMENLDKACINSKHRVKYPMSHDEIGNIDGTRLLTKIFCQYLRFDKELAPSDLAHRGQKLIETISKGEWLKMNNLEKQWFLKSLDCINDIEKIREFYFDSIQKIKLALAKVYSLPGPKMIFQGEESINYSYFKFFRKFSIGREKCLESKGYEPGLDAFLTSKMSENIFDEVHKRIFDSVSLFMKALNGFCEENDALTIGKIEKTIVHPLSKLHAIHCVSGDSEVFTISNFSQNKYEKNYGISFPEGLWLEVLNSDEEKYFGEGKYLNEGVLEGKYNYISLPKYGFIMFKRIDNLD